MHFHSSGMDSLYEFVPKNILPRDYGGEDKSSEELMSKLNFNSIERKGETPFFL